MSSVSVFGVPQRRSEDPRFLRGEGRYLENVGPPGSLRAHFVRSIFPHARVAGVDVGAAADAPGVVAVYVAADLELPPQPPSSDVEGAGGTLEGAWERPCLAHDVVRFVGEPVAVVVAETREQAEDAAELVLVDLDPLEAVVDAEAAAREGAPLLFPDQGTNVCRSFERDWEEDVLAGSDVVVRGRFVNQRLAPCPLEVNAIAVEPTGDGVTVWGSTQVPFDLRDDVADALGLGRDRVRAIAPDVGGGFGAKLVTYPEYLVVAAAAMRLGRPVRWFETRSESMVNMTHGRAHVHEVELGATRDGKVIGLRLGITADMGAYPVGAFLPENTTDMSPGVYAFERVAYQVHTVVTNTTPVMAYRGAGRPEAAAMIERAMDMLADELTIDPVELRRRNLVPPDAFPYETVTGHVYDSGDYARALDEALRIAGYDELRAEQARRRDRGDRLQLGIGVATYVEVTSFESKEYASVEVNADGSITVLTGTSPHGQGHETAFAQLAAGVLGVGFDDVRVVHSDTRVVPRGEGTWGSRSLQAGGSAVFEQSRAVLERARTIAAQVLEVDVADVVHDGARFHVAGAPDRAVSLAEVAAAADAAGGDGLRSEGRFREPGSTFPFGCHVAVVEVDTETGGVRLVRHVAVDDCGRILNPLLVDGQVHGGLGQGIAQALYEEILFDEVGNPMTANLTTYLFPSAAELPSFELAHTETPTHLNPLGAKGIGESATIGSTPAVQNAVVDAVSHLGVRHIDLPASPERVWRAIHGGTQE
jgi:carbon-monoxide dehydrogenase large subunit